jgi:predicted flap endonuclease-1-like 5' DNA nuclease
MNETASVPGESLLPESTDLITGIHFGLILLLALGAIAIIVIGIRRNRRRKQAEQVVEDRIAAAEETPTPALRETAPTPVTPPPATAAAPGFSDEDRSDLDVEPGPLADEPIAAAAPQDASPAAEASPDPLAFPAPPAPPVSGTAISGTPGDGPVTQLKGLGPKVAARLAELGITTVGQLASLSDDEARALNADLGPFAGRMERDRWRDQARLLAAGDRAGFEATYGRL